MLNKQKRNERMLLFTPVRYNDSSYIILLNLVKHGSFRETFIRIIVGDIGMCEYVWQLSCAKYKHSRTTLESHTPSCGFINKLAKSINADETNKTSAKKTKWLITNKHWYFCWNKPENRAFYRGLRLSGNRPKSVHDTETCVWLESPV